MDATSTIAEPVTTKTPRDAVFANIERKLKKLARRHKWPKDQSDAAHSYVHTLVYDDAGNPHAINNTYSKLIAIARRHSDQQAQCVGRSVRRQFTIACYQHAGQLTTVELPGFYEEWFAKYFAECEGRQPA